MPSFKIRKDIEIKDNRNKLSKSVLAFLIISLKTSTRFSKITKNPNSREVRKVFLHLHRFCNQVHLRNCELLLVEDDVDSEDLTLAAIILSLTA